jgi:hypothetical protein
MKLMTLTQSIHNLHANMTWNKALIYTTSFSYLGATVATLMGLPVMDNVGSLPQALMYAAMFVVLLLSLKYSHLRMPLAAGYGVMAMLSFSGIQRWIYYAGDRSILGPWMAAWDLALAVALLLDETPR